jgi:hypothetical protein
MIKEKLQLLPGNKNAYLLRHYENKGIKVFDSSTKGKEEYCGPCQLSRITSFALLLQEMFSVRGISIIDAYLKGTADST